MSTRQHSTTPDLIKLIFVLVVIALWFVIGAVAAANAQTETRGAVAFSVTSNSNLGDKQAALGALSTVEVRKNRFGFASTGTVSQLTKNSGGSGHAVSFEAEGRVFISGDVFVDGNVLVDQYGVTKYHKSAVAVGAGAGIVRPTFTLSGQIDHDLSGVTRRNSFVGRFQAWAPTKGKIHPYFEISSGVVGFNQAGSQTGFSFRAAGGVWIGGSR